MHARTNALDAAARAQSVELTALVNAAELPEPLPVAAGQSAQVLTVTGGVLATSAQGSRTLALLDPAVAAAHADAKPRTVATTAIDADGESRVVVTRASYAGKPVLVIVAASLAEVRSTENSLRGLDFIAAPLLVAAFAGLAWLLLGRALRTVSLLGAAATAVGDPDSDERLPVPDSRDEIHQLAVTLNAMLDRLAAGARRERAFLDDAAHELRTPLASARLQLEIAGLHPHDQDWQAIAADTEADLVRLGELLEDLLALARLDSASVRLERLDLAGFAGKPAATGPIWVLGDRRALRRGVDNLVANARRHANDRVEVTVIRTGPESGPDGGTDGGPDSGTGTGWAELRVDDDGPGIPVEVRARIFERFARNDGDRGREGGGTGLGLAIVAATARAHGGEVFVTDSPLGGARVGLRLPVEEALSA